MKTINTIDDVIIVLQSIINESIKNKNTQGYFAALYQKVTIKVKEGIANNIFDNGSRMEKLDIIFAKRYINAYYDFQQNKTISGSWEKSFSITDDYFPIVLQHLLIGMNAHINLDLGIAAAQVSEEHPIEDLKNDFDKINELLSSLVMDVENNLSTIWPFLKKILKFTKKIDDFLVDFSMQKARDEAWNFAVVLSNTQSSKIQETIQLKDLETVRIASLITNPGTIPSFLFMIIRLGEKGTIPQKIVDLIK
ncbi:MAG: DUF5995 family protein [Polaribacter sp.]